VLDGQHSTKKEKKKSISQRVRKDESKMEKAERTREVKHKRKKIYLNKVSEDKVVKRLK
jgi:hypothetical protein